MSLNVRDNAFAISLLEKVLKSFLDTSSIPVAPHLIFILNSVLGLASLCNEINSLTSFN